MKQMTNKVSLLAEMLDTKKDVFWTVLEIHEVTRTYDLLGSSARTIVFGVAAFPNKNPFFVKIFLPQEMDHSIFLLYNARSIRPRAREDRANRYHSRRGTKRDRGSVCTAAKDRVKVMK